MVDASKKKADQSKISRTTIGSKEHGDGMVCLEGGALFIILVMGWV